MQITRFNIKTIYQRFSICLFFIIVSAFFLLVCTKSSPLYFTNDWTDANASFTLGKSMMNGKVLYMDIFNQKGPLFYTMHGFFYLISNKTFLGVFLFEVIFFSIFLFYSYKIVRIYLNKRYGLFVIPIISFLILNNRFFAHGDSVEQFSMTFLMISLYYLLKLLKLNKFKPIANRVILFNGILAGCIIWLKYSMIGFWFGWILVVSIISIDNKNYRNTIFLNFIFLIGIIIATIPFIIYFGINGALKNWIDTYFFVNFNQYSQHSTVLNSMFFIIENFARGLGRNIVFGIISLFGIVTVLISKYFAISFTKRIAILIPFVFLTIGVFGGGRAYIYYFLIISPISIFGIIYFLRCLELGLTKTYLKKNNYSYLITIVTFFLFALTIITNHNTYLLKFEKKDLVQFSFAEIINSTSNPTLLNYGWLDMGLYTTTGIVPNIKYFQKQNIDYSRFPINMDEQNRYLEEKLVDFVVTRESANNTRKSLSLNDAFKSYQLVSKKNQSYEGENYTYKLYKLK